MSRQRDGATHKGRRLVSDALVQVCRGNRIEILPDCRPEFVAAARHHRLAPLAQVYLRDFDGTTAESLQHDRDQAKTTFVFATIALDELNEILDGIPWVTFKGPVLSEHAHPVPGIRTFTDLDVLVSPRMLRTAIGQILQAGWQVADADHALRSVETPGEMHCVSPNGVTLDLHWSAINMRKTRRRFPAMSEQVLADRVRVPVGLTSTWTLSPADTLVHVCLHAALTGAHKLLLILDADQLARHVGDWGAVIDHAHRWGAAQAVWLVLDRARRLLGTPLPPDLRRELSIYGGLRAINGMTNRLSPVPRLRKDESLARLVARSARPSASETIATIGRKAARGVSDRLGRQVAQIPWEQQALAQADALEVYLKAVEREAGPGPVP